MEHFLFRPARSGRFLAFTCFRGIRLLHLVLGTADVEGEHLVVLQLEARDGNMLGVIGILGYLGQLHRQLLHVENLGLGAFHRIHDVIVGPLG